MTQNKSIQLLEPLKILITGGTGLVGKKLAFALRTGGHEVRILSRNPQGIDGGFYGDYEKDEMDANALKDLDIVIHLAGASVAGGRWTKKRKREILQSRTGTAKMIFRNLMENNISLKRYITASGTGYYGSRKGEILTEQSSPGTAFLSDVCVQWEDAGTSFKNTGAKVYANRIGVVLSLNGCFIRELLPILKFNLLSGLGSGKQFTPWIHIDDLIKILVKETEGELAPGVYNAVSPQPATNKEIITALAKAAGKKIILPNIPAFFIQLALGEMSTELLADINVVPANLQSQQFEFTHPEIQDAMNIELA
ncbi:MAG: TIGR01777 family protein [Bacteroidetes bacterium]|nr:TIGR01777 family protein [Bacteroidota bacterium]